MPTKRKKTMNNQLPSTQEASLVLGFPRNQEINSSKHFNRIFIKVQTNSAILMQARSYNLQWWKNKVKKQSTHQTRTPGSQKKKDFVCVWDSKDRLGLDHSWSQRTKKLWANRHCCSRQSWDRAAWVMRKTVEMWPFGGSEKLGLSPWQRIFPCARTGFPPSATSWVSDQLHPLQQP